MRLVIQRVRSAQVTEVASKAVVGEIKQGLFVLVGFKKGDTHEGVDALADKLVKLRIMADEEGKMNFSIQDIGKSLLVVSQFTLYANTKEGNRPSFIQAESPTEARELYHYFVEKLKQYKIEVQTGSFGNYMSISAQLDGPVTIIVDDETVIR